MIANNFPRVPELDGVRGLAIVLVLMGHLFRPLMPEAAGFGVSLFFALSGYLITTILMSEYRSSGAISIGSFYLRRARRLLPALVLFLVVFAIWALLADWPVRDVLHSTIPVLFYSANWSGAVGWGVGHYMDHAWSLSVEEQFYIVWPALIVFILRMRYAWLPTLALAMLVVFLRYAAVHLLKLPADPINTLLRYDEIFLGCVLALSQLRVPSWVGYMALAVLLVFATIIGIRTVGNDARFVLISVITTAVVGSAVQLRWLFASAVLRYFGRISYSLYLWHFPIWVITKNPWITLLSSIVIAELSWRLVEHPVMTGKYLKWLTPRKSINTDPKAAFSVAGGDGK